MRRRALLAIVAGAGLALTAATRAEPVARVGVLGPDEQPRFAELVAGLREGLRAQGLHDQRLELMEHPVRRGDEAATEFGARALRDARVGAIFAIGSEVARIVRRAAPDVPVVFITPGDPVAAGLVTSLARPGGNLTGVTFEFPELSGKRLELARDIVGAGRRVLVVVDPLDASPRQALAAVRAAAPALGMSLIEHPLRSGEDVAGAIGALPGAAALLMIPGGAPAAHAAALMHAAHAARIATVFPARTAATREALATYGARDADVARDAARLVGRIVSGARAGEIPVERPTRLEFGVNARTARAIGLAIPPALLARADEVIE